MKRNLTIIKVIRALLAVSCIGALSLGIYRGIAESRLNTDYFITAFTALLSLTLTFVPNFIRHIGLIAFPAILQTIFSIFVFLAMFCGEILSFYDLFGWWDSMLHIASGMIFGLIGYLLFITLNRDISVRCKLHPASVILFAVCFSMACGMVWEIFEFSGDSLLGMNMQRWQSSMPYEEWAALQNSSNLSNPGLTDTMKDIICDTAGTLCTIPVCLFLVRRSNQYVKSDIPMESLVSEVDFKAFPVPAPASIPVSYDEAAEKTA